MKLIVLSIIYSLIIGNFVFRYLKYKKNYDLLTIPIFLSALFFNTPLSLKLNKSIDNILVVILVILTGIIFYLFYKDNKTNDK